MYPNSFYQTKPPIFFWGALLQNSGLDLCQIALFFSLFFF